VTRTSLTFEDLSYLTTTSIWGTHGLPTQVARAEDSAQSTVLAATRKLTLEKESLEQELREQIDIAREQAAEVKILAHSETAFSYRRLC
jgi:hypothetical protein